MHVVVADGSKHENGGGYHSLALRILEIHLIQQLNKATKELT